MGVRVALRGEADIVLVAEAADTLDADQTIAEYQPSIAIVDHQLYGGLLRRRVPAFRATGPATRIVLLADRLGSDRLLALLRSGIRGIVCGSGLRQDLARAVRSVADGGGFMAPEFAGAVITAAGGHPAGPDRRPRPELARLTERERTVLDLLCQGTTNREIAGTLRVSEKTVKFHVSNILAKTETRTRARLIAAVAAGAGRRVTPERGDRRAG
jgi:DNA-binding NarL/FixJ family response regulator